MIVALLVLISQCPHDIMSSPTFNGCHPPLMLKIYYLDKLREGKSNRKYVFVCALFLNRTIENNQSSTKNDQIINH